MVHHLGSSPSMLKEHFLEVKFFLLGAGSVHQSHRNFPVHQRQPIRQMFGLVL